MGQPTHRMRVVNEDASSRSVGSSVDIRERVVDGVRVLHFPEDSGRTAATLIFGVGARDETLPTLGTLHALEHAVMAGVRRTPIDINGGVGISTTQFTASGSPEHVSAFLTGVCGGLADPPIDRLAHEARVLQAEGEGDRPASSPAAVVRYGFRGLGVIDGPGPGPSGVQGQSVRAAAARWFVAANALLVIEGVCPDDLHLPLPVGPRPPHAEVPIRHVTQPSAVTMDGPACELNFVMPAEPAVLTRLAATVLDDRLTEVLRHELGLVYTLDIDPIRTLDGYDMTVRTDPTPGRVRDCVRAMVGATGTLLTDGPTEVEVEHARAVMCESMSGRDAKIGDRVDAAIAQLIGLEALPVNVDDVAGCTRDQVTSHLGSIATDLIYVVDAIVEPDLASLGLELIEPGRTTTGPLPAGEVFRPPLIALARAKEARASRVALTSTGLAHAYDGRLQQLTWAEVAGVMRDEDGDLVVFGRDGQAIPVGPTMYKKGQRLVDVTLSHVAGDLVYDAPSDTDADHPGPM